MKQLGAVQVENFGELVDTVLALTCSPLPSGRGISIITHSGGVSVIETDSCIRVGLEVPQFREETIRELRRIVPVAGTSIGNPLDAWPMYYALSAKSGTISDALKVIAFDKNIHSLVLHIGEIRCLKRTWGEAFEGRLQELVNIMVSGCEYVRNETGKLLMVCVEL